MRLLKRRFGEIGRGRLIGPDIKKTRFEHLKAIILDDYRVNGRRSLETVNAVLKALSASFGDDYARDITLDRLNGYVASRLEKGRQPATIVNELAVLRRAFRLAERAGRAICPPFPQLHVQNARQGFFEEAAFRAVLEYLPDPVKPVAEFGYLTGWRLGEILSLEWRQVDFRAGIVRLEPGTTKNSEGRVLSFVGYRLLDRLLRVQRQRTDTIERTTGQIIRWVFHREGAPIRSFRRVWRTACTRAGVPGRLFHDLRRTAVRNLERAGVPRSVAMKVTGHKTEAVYRRYAIVSEADIAEAVQRLDRLHAEQHARPTESSSTVVALADVATAKVQPKSRPTSG